MTTQPPLTDALTYSTLRIMCKLQNNTISTGTGFLYRFGKSNSKSYIPVIVTNKHVVKGAIWGEIHFHRSDKNGEPIPGAGLPIAFDDFQSRWIDHPDAEVDLCAIPLAPLEPLLQQHDAPVFLFMLIILGYRNLKN